MAAAAQDSGGSLSVHDVLRRWAPAYLEQFGAAMPARQREVLHRLLACRTPALLAVLHTWTRTLEYHPHVHYLVPGGGLSLDQRQWISSRPNFLLPVKVLSDRCRTLFREALQKQMPEALADLSPKVWTQRW